MVNSNSKSKSIKSNDFLKKILLKIKENLMSEEIKNEIKNELLEPFYIEICNFILPHYIIFIILFIVIIILLFCIILIISNTKH